MRVLICVFDALRPDLVSPELTPNIAAFARRGTRYLNSRSTYPTETRVNQSAVTTGCLPRRHGVVGNAFLAADLGGGVVNTGDDAVLRKAMAAGPVLRQANFGERLQAAGRRYASLSAGTPGGGRLINWSAEEDGTYRLAMKAPEACVPRDLFDRCVDRVGPLPEYTLPGGAWINWAVNAYLHVFAPSQPDLMLLWMCEPDESFHWHGIGSPESRQAMRAVDAAFGRILAHHAEEIADGALQVIAMSDHGQISLEGPRLDVAAQLTDAGFPTSRKGLDDAEIALTLANGGGLWLRDSDRLEPVLRWLLDQPWCGPVFTKDGALGTLRQAEIAMDHARAPDISLVLRSREAPGPHGPPGLSLHDAPYPEGGGCHGGLSRWELRNFIALGGTAFRLGTEIDVPAGNPDILPTVMRLLGLEQPANVDGRQLSEAFVDGPDPHDVVWERRRLTASNTVGPVTKLDIAEVGAHRYLDEATVI
ncbi:MAG: alkaline phosphatase family protein [Pseudomonadota bacterium]